MVMLEGKEDKAEKKEEEEVMDKEVDKNDWRRWGKTRITKRWKRKGATTKRRMWM